LNRRSATELENVQVGEPSASALVAVNPSQEPPPQNPAAVAAPTSEGTVATANQPSDMTAPASERPSTPRKSTEGSASPASVALMSLVARDEQARRKSITRRRTGSWSEHRRQRSDSSSSSPLGSAFVIPPPPVTSGEEGSVEGQVEMNSVDRNVEETS
jgi:hypothetical protein